MRFWHHLFKVKRILLNMGELWVSQKYLLKLLESDRRHYRLIERCNLIRTHMHQFLQSLASYVFNEVVESQFHDFLSKLDAIASYDELKQKATSMIDNLLIKSFLQRDSDNIFKVVSDLLHLCSRFCKIFSIIEKYSMISAQHAETSQQPFPLERFMKMIDSIWKSYENAYLLFLAKFETSLSPEIRALSFKFDFNSYHSK